MRCVVFLTESLAGLLPRNAFSDFVTPQQTGVAFQADSAWISGTRNPRAAEGPIPASPTTRYQCPQDSRGSAIEAEMPSEELNRKGSQIIVAKSMSHDSVASNHA